MTDKPENLPAFPRAKGLQYQTPSRADIISTEGMTLRDYFAAKAMTVMMNIGSFNVEDVAKGAYIQADAMIEARLK